MTLSAFITAHREAGLILVRVERAEGSTPREAGACMAVTAHATMGTIGGGQLEFHCIDIARQMLSDGAGGQSLDIPLGPQMGQCCGGRVRVSLKRLSAADAALVAARATPGGRSRRRSRPCPSGSA